MRALITTKNLVAIRRSAAWISENGVMFGHSVEALIDQYEALYQIALAASHHLDSHPASEDTAREASLRSLLERLGIN